MTRHKYTRCLDPNVIDGREGRSMGSTETETSVVGASGADLLRFLYI